MDDFFTWTRLDSQTHIITTVVLRFIVPYKYNGCCYHTAQSDDEENYSTSIFCAYMLTIFFNDSCSWPEPMLVDNFATSV